MAEFQQGAFSLPRGFGIKAENHPEPVDLHDLDGLDARPRGFPEFREWKSGKTDFAGPSTFLSFSFLKSSNSIHRDPFPGTNQGEDKSGKQPIRSGEALAQKGVNRLLRFSNRIGKIYECTRGLPSLLRGTQYGEN